MKHENPFSVIKSRHITEKAVVLENLKDAQSNASVSRCQNPKYVFLVDPNASKPEIARAVEEIYSDQGVKVVGVNTINVKPKARRVRGRPGMRSKFKKAVVTLKAGDQLDNV